MPELVAPLRAHDDPRVETIGHLGCGIRPSARGRRVASWAVAKVLTHARSREMGDVVAVRRIDNLASIRALEKCGGRRGPIAALGGSRVRHSRFDLG